MSGERKPKAIIWDLYVGDCPECREKGTAIAEFDIDGWVRHFCIDCVALRLDMLSPPPRRTHEHD